MHTFYRCFEEDEAKAARVLEAECKRLLQNLRHEARVQAVRDYYASTNIKMSKVKCRVKFLSKERYMKVITYSKGLVLSFLDFIRGRSAEISLCQT